MQKVIGIIGVVVVLLGLFSPFLFAQEKISLRIDFPIPEITKVGDYHRIRMEGLSNVGLPGEPMLPIRTVKLLIPYGKEAGEMRVTGEDKVILPGSYIIEPAQRPVPIGCPGSFTLPKPEIYNSSKAFPETLSSHQMTQRMRGYRLLLVNIHPIEYIPAMGQVSYYKSMKVELDLETPTAPLAPDPMYRGLPQDKEKVREIIDNPDALDTYPQRSPLQPPYEYLIITSDAFKAYIGSGSQDDLTDLINHKIAKPHITNATILGVETDIYPSLSGSDNQEKIRNCIKHYYQNHGTTYVLLVGDGDAGGPGIGGEHDAAPIIPHRGFYDIVNEDFPGYEDEDSDIPADIYYACLDGTFDNDGDGIYGETNDGPGGGEVDLYAEVYVGRAPVDSITELSNFVNKTITYENSTTAYLQTVYMVGEQLDTAPTWGGDYKDEIRTWSESHSYKTTGFTGSDYYNVSTLYDRDYPGHDWPESILMGYINSGLHIINHDGHANVNYGMKMYNSDADALTNTDYFFGYTQGCYCGAFDNRSTTGSYYNYDSILEHFTTEAHGAFAFIGNSRYGWYVQGSTNGSSQRFDREFWDAVLREGEFHIGKANQDSKEDNAGVINSIDAVRWCYFTINLFGDPETSLYLPQNAPIVSSISPTSGGGSISVTITGTHFTGATAVKLTKSGESDINATSFSVVSDTQITASFNLTGVTPGYWNVVITGSGGTYKGTLPKGFGIKPVVNSISPDNQSHLESSVNVTLNGDNFVSGVTVKLTKNGQSDISGTSVTVVSSTRITCTFTILAREPGYWDVVVTSSDGVSGALSRGFQITSPSPGIISSSPSHSGCFIATAAYLPVYPLPGRQELDTLRQFRDQHLLTNPLGRASVSTYYRISPLIADFIRDKEPLKAVVRLYLKPVVWVAERILE